jgi:hypothetical protein
MTFEEVTEFYRNAGKKDPERELHQLHSPKVMPGSKQSVVTCGLCDEVYDRSKKFFDFCSPEKCVYTRDDFGNMTSATGLENEIACEIG